MKYLLRTSFFIVFPLVVLACGGGSVGTGVEPKTFTFSGSIVSPDRAPIPGAVLTVLNSDVAATTGSEGEFRLSSPIAGDTAAFRLEAEGNQAEFSVDMLAEQAERDVQLTIVYDSASNNVRIDQYSVRVAVVGACDDYFSNGRPVTQTAEVPEGTRCTLRVEVRADGEPADDIEYVIQTRRCEDNSSWHTVDDGRIESRSGVDRIDIVWRDDSEHCVYRVRAPENIAGADKDSAHIRTLTKRMFDGEDLSPQPTPTADPSPSETPTPDATPSPCPTPVVCESPATICPVATPCVISTATPTPSASPGPTLSPTSTASPSPTPTPTLKPTPTPKPSATPSPSPSPSSTPTPAA